MAADESEIHPDIWRAITNVSIIPNVGDTVSYLASGHAGQFQLPLNPSPPPICCKVVSIRYLADAATDETFAEFTLQPSEASSSESEPPSIPSLNLLISRKVITHSDAIGYFTIPVHLGSVLPAVDRESNTSETALTVSDVHGREFELMQKWTKKSGSNLTFRKGWRQFLKLKKLVEGDTLVFMKKSDGQWVIGIQPTGRVGHQEVQDARRHEEVQAALSSAPKKLIFLVTFFPLLGPLRAILTRNFSQALEQAQPDEASVIPAVADKLRVAIPYEKKKAPRSFDIEQAQPDEASVIPAVADIPRVAKPSEKKKAPRSSGHAGVTGQCQKCLSRCEARNTKILFGSLDYKEVLNLTKFDSIGALREVLEMLYKIPGQLSESSEEWQLMYTDDQDDLCMIRDISWDTYRDRLFCNKVKQLVIRRTPNLMNPNLMTTTKGAQMTQEVQTEEQSPIRTISVAGLKNFRNNCFLNVILQVLGSSSYFLPTLQDGLVNYRIIGKTIERMPLTSNLISLLRELRIIRDRRTVLDPKEVMDSMARYGCFSLTSQQDAAEALSLLLSSLSQEITQFMVQEQGENELQKWQQQILGPFDGASKSILRCTKCLSMISANSELFSSLLVSPITDGNSQIMTGCSLANCLKHFTDVERIEYKCRQCWHIAALRYASVKKEEAKITVLRECVKSNSCGCEALFSPEEIKSTGFASKQLRITRCPKILCLHVKLASRNQNFETIKLQGHVSFPMSLDIFPFTEGATTGHNITEKNMGGKGSLQMRDMGTGDASSLRLGGSTSEPSGHNTEFGNHNRHTLAQTVSNDIDPAQSYPKEKGDLEKEVPVINTKDHLYSLFSVVVHFGKPEGGHYAVYKRVRSTKHGGHELDKALEEHSSHWFYVSDTEVFNVSEKTVLSAEASLLFYEKI